MFSISVCFAPLIRFHPSTPCLQRPDSTFDLLDPVKIRYDYKTGLIGNSLTAAYFAAPPVSLRTDVPDVSTIRDSNRQTGISSAICGYNVCFLHALPVRKYNTPVFMIPSFPVQRFETVGDIGLNTLSLIRDGVPCMPANAFGLDSSAATIRDRFVRNTAAEI